MIININLFDIKTTDLLCCGTNIADCWGGLVYLSSVRTLDFNLPGMMLFQMKLL